MSILGELERTEAGTGMPRCQAMIPVVLVEGLPPELLPCTELAVGWFDGLCACGHSRRGWLCADHEVLAGHGGCKACREAGDDPHDCPLAITGGGRG